MIVLAYLWLLALVPLLVEKDDPEVQWHAQARPGADDGRADPAVRRLHGRDQHRQHGDARPRLRARPDAACSPGSAILALHVVAIIKGVNGTRLIIRGSAIRESFLASVAASLTRRGAALAVRERTGRIAHRVDSRLSAARCSPVAARIGAALPLHADVQPLRRGGDRARRRRARRLERRRARRAVRAVDADGNRDDP